MTDFETVARAEERSFAADWVKELIDEHGAPVIGADGAWRFPVSEGEEQ